VKYALLIYDDPKAWADADEASRGAMMQEYGEFWDDLDKKGMIRGGQQLAPHTSATVVSAHNGTTLTTDGPYAETKEQLGGFFVIECDSLDQALEAASRIPSLRIGGQVEVRPIVEM